MSDPTLERWRSRITDTENVDPSSLLANPRNWRVHPREQREALAAVLDRVGWVAHVVVNRTTGHVVDGHLRVDLAVERGEPSLPVVYVELTEDEEALALATLDPLSAMAVPDKEQLASLTDELGANAAGILDAVLGPAREGSALSVDPEPDAITDTPAEPITREGDTIRLGDHVLVCGDTFAEADRGKLFGGERVAAIVTDPPYAIYGSSTGVSSEVTDDKIVRPFFASLWRIMAEHLERFGHGYCCCDWRSWASVWDGAQRSGMTIRNMLVWDKGSSGLGANYFNTYELLAFAAKLPKQNAMRTDTPAGVRAVHRPNMLRFERVPGAQREHNAQKPIALLSELIGNSTDEGDTVADLFGGSGSTLIAAEELGRVCRVMEIDPGWCDVIVARWEEHTGRRARRPRRGKR